ncbi:hypothetical protein D3P09_02780 [Paenibacillus pinisoli]|uniref:Uncharacterized protein n=1 Tax=Paenibacillus pinisoli TaxID=1276110 RepID=A0A3A6PKR4_9BACL|nr:hypothetical protein [Paenibacillus pinisoli]RJX40960.1 hypothetical protein D3P09_02780 [Paenibacillus pinisoli]
MKIGKEEKGKSEPNIVATYQLGNTTSYIADNSYRDKTPDETQQVWKDFYSAGWNIWDEVSRKKGKEADD